MATRTPRLLNEDLENAIADSHIRIRAGWFPGSRLLDVGSENGYLGAALAREAGEWTVYAANRPEDAPGNLEQVDLSLPKIPFENASLAGVVASAVDEPLHAWGPDLAREVHRVLVPGGRLLVVYRAPTVRRPGAKRGLASNAEQTLGKAGFDPVIQTRERWLADGSELCLIRAVRPSREQAPEGG